MIITVGKIGVGTEDNPFRPDTEFGSWKVISETATEFIIEVLD